MYTFLGLTNSATKATAGKALQELQSLELGHKMEGRKFEEPPSYNLAYSSHYMGGGGGGVCSLNRVYLEAETRVLKRK